MLCNHDGKCHVLCTGIYTMEVATECTLFALYFDICFYVLSKTSVLHDPRWRWGLNSYWWFLSLSQLHKYTPKHTHIQSAFSILLAGCQDYIYSLLSATWLWVQQTSFGTAGEDMTLQEALGYLSHSTLCTSVFVITLLFPLFFYISFVSDVNAKLFGLRLCAVIQRWHVQHTEQFSY